MTTTTTKHQNIEGKKSITFTLNGWTCEWIRIGVKYEPCKREKKTFNSIRMELFKCLGIADDIITRHSGYSSRFNETFFSTKLFHSGISTLSYRRIKSHSWRGARSARHNNTSIELGAMTPRKMYSKFIYAIQRNGNQFTTTRESIKEERNKVE